MASSEATGTATRVKSASKKTKELHCLAQPDEIPRRPWLHQRSVPKYLMIGLAQPTAHPEASSSSTEQVFERCSCDLSNSNQWLQMIAEEEAGFEAKLYSQVPNHSIWRQAGYPKLPSTQLSNLQRSMMDGVFFPPYTDPLHNVVSSSAYKDRIFFQGHKCRMQFPNWIEVVSKKSIPKSCRPLLFGFPAPTTLDLGLKYEEPARKLRMQKEQA